MEAAAFRACSSENVSPHDTRQLAVHNGLHTHIHAHTYPHFPRIPLLFSFFTVMVFHEEDRDEINRFSAHADGVGSRRDGTCVRCLKLGRLWAEHGQSSFD